jgi:LmbE family N-acetylglucosaminyl deacetylase
VVIATSGQAGQAAGLASTPEELGRVREREALEAARFLGIERVHLFGYTDGRLDEVDETEIVERVVRLIREERPDVAVTFGPEGAGNEHRDHKRISHVAAVAVSEAGDREAFPEQISAGLAPHFVKKFYYMTGRGNPWRRMAEEFMPVTTVIDITDFVATKLEAFKLHRSQRQWTTKLEEWIEVNHNTEVYHLASSTVAGLPEIETDLFDGL